MKTTAVTVVRVYMTEGSGLRRLLRYLHDESRVRGVTVFRGVTGFGRSGTVHAASFVDLSMQLPVVVEFFETPERAAPILEHLNTLLEPGHVLTWSATVNEEM
jgi:hypothetical protein